jgi:hypothetical protein
VNNENGFISVNEQHCNGVIKMNNNNSDPIMTVREFLTLPRDDANTFLNLWANRQPNPSLAVAQAQGLRLKAALAVASGKEQDHPAPYGEDKADYDYGDRGPRETHDEYDEEYCFECCESICDYHGRHSSPPRLRWKDQVDPSGRTFKQAWKELGAGIERENQRTAALNAAAPKTDSLSLKE